MFQVEEATELSTKAFWGLWDHGFSPWDKTYLQFDENSYILLCLVGTSPVTEQDMQAVLLSDAEGLQIPLT